MAGTDWLANLETKVSAAVERIASLRQENQGLARRVHELEAELAAFPESPPHPAAGLDAAIAGGASAAPSGAAEADSFAAWREERNQVKLRVKRLTAMLEELMTAAEDAAAGGDQQ